MPSLRPSPNLKQNLLLQDARGKEIVLKASHLEKWFAQAESSLLSNTHKLTPDEIKANTPTLATQFLGHFDLQDGLRTPQNVIDFFKSHAGKATLAMISKNLAETADAEEHLQMDLLIKQRQRQRLMSFLLLGLLHRREARKHLNEAIQHDIDKRHKTEKETQKQLAEASSYESSREMYLQKTLDAYLDASRALECELNNKHALSITLEHDLAELEKHILLTAKKYSLYNSQLDLAYEDLAEFTLLPVISIESIQLKINSLSGDFNDEADEINKHLLAGEDDIAREKMEMCNARNLRIGLLLDMIAVIDGRKVMYTQDGLPTQDFHKAEFIISNQKKLVQNNGKYYILNAGQDSENLSNEEKEAGERAYLRLRPEIIGVKQLIQHNENLEQKVHNEKKSVLSARSEAMQQDILLLANQLTQMQASCASTEAALTPRTPTPAMKPMPTPTPTPTVSPQASTQCLSNSYRHMLLLMKNNPSERSIEWLKTNIANTQSPKKLQEQVNTLSPGKPIPAELMKQLLARRHLGHQWLTPFQTDITQTNLTPYSTSPFKTRPTPGGL
jgi:effector protein LidA